MRRTQQSFHPGGFCEAQRAYRVREIKAPTPDEYHAAHPGEPITVRGAIRTKKTERWSLLRLFCISGPAGATVEDIRRLTALPTQGERPQAGTPWDGLEVAEVHVNPSGASWLALVFYVKARTTLMEECKHKKKRDPEENE